MQTSTSLLAAGQSKHIYESSYARLIDRHRLDAAIKASKKAQVEVAEEVGTSKEWINRLVTGAETNPSSDVVVRLAAAVGTQVSYLYGESPRLSPDDENQLLQFRDWIDE